MKRMKYSDQYLNFGDIKNFRSPEEYASKFLKNQALNLNIPASFKREFGVEAACIQLFITLLRNPIKLNFVLNTENKSVIGKSFLDVICARLADTVSLDQNTDVAINTIGDEISRVLRDGLENQQSQAKSEYYNFYGEVESEVTRPFDLPKYSGPFYNNSKAVDIEEFTRVIRGIIEPILPTGVDPTKTSRMFYARLAKATRELFLNINEHAGNDHLGNPLDRRAHGLIFNCTSVSRDDFARVATSGAELGFFLNEWKEKVDQELSLLEISVIDSGPGLARRWLKKDYSSFTKKEEIEAVLSCFEKHRTSKIRPSSGVGLYSVLKEIRELKGFFRFRSGRLVVERFMAYDEGNIELKPSHFHSVENWFEGTVCTLLFPMISEKP